MTCSNDTHIRSCGIMLLGIDARVRERWDVEYYVKHHMVGGFFNDALNTGKSFNAQYVTTEMRCENLPPSKLATRSPACHDAVPTSV